VPTTNGCRHGNKEDGPRVLPEWRRGHEGEDTPSESESSRGENGDGEEGNVTPPPHSPLCKALPFLGDIFSRQTGFAVGMHHPKQPRTETRPSTGSPLLLHLMLVSPDLYRTSVVPVLMKTIVHVPYAAP
jgi:hypothetical protein